MGWWGVNVMEGDPPMDAEAEILDALYAIHVGRNGIQFVPSDDEDDEDDGGNLEFLALLKEDGVASDVLNRLKAGVASEIIIATQVLGEVIICNGFPLPDDVREAAIQASKDDKWASYADDRKEAMELYAKRITEYNGTAVEPVSEGLFAKIAEVLEGREPG